MAIEGSRDKRLEINVRDDSKLVEVWLTRSEKQDQALRKRLKPLYQKYNDQNYLVAVFLSGSENLEQRTSDLLCYNKKRVAELDVQREKALGITMAM